MEKKKRKRTKASAEDIVEYVAKSLDTFVAVAESARSVFEGMQVDGAIIEV